MPLLAPIHSVGPLCHPVWAPPNLRDPCVVAAGRTAHIARRCRAAAVPDGGGRRRPEAGRRRRWCAGRRRSPTPAQCRASPAHCHATEPQGPAAETPYLGQPAAVPSGLLSSLSRPADSGAAREGHSPGSWAHDVSPARPLSRRSTTMDLDHSPTPPGALCALQPSPPPQRSAWGDVDPSAVPWGERLWQPFGLLCLDVAFFLLSLFFHYFFTQRNSRVVVFLRL